MTQAVHRRAVLLAAAATLLASCSEAASRRVRQLGVTAGPVPPTATPEQALGALLDGNRRFAAGAPLHAHDVAEARVFARVQHPLAAVLGCADARVPPEALFDQGFGDLFVVRTIGATLDEAALASIEYAVTELAVPLVVVLGHDRCGAIAAAVDAAHSADQELPRPPRTWPPQLAAVLDRLEPLARAALDSGGSDVEGDVMRVAVASTVRTITAEPSVAARGVRVVAARYDLDDGTVRLL